MKVKNFKRKTHLGKMTLSFAVCFMMLCGFTFLTHFNKKPLTTHAAKEVTIELNGPILNISGPAGTECTLIGNFAGGGLLGTYTIPAGAHGTIGTKSIDLMELLLADDDINPQPNTIYEFYVTSSFGKSNSVFFAYYELPPDPVKEGHTFAGWYWDEELTIPYAGEPIFEDSILYAKFIPNIYTITFDTLGGNTLAPIEAEYNTTITPPTPTRLGHKFLGWYIDINLTEPFDAENTLITSDITLYAKWEAQTVTVTFMVDGEVYTTLEVPYGSILINNTTAAQYVAAMGKLYTDAGKKNSLI